jgi:hypothetical protein
MRKKKGKALFLSLFIALEGTVGAVEYGRAGSSDNSVPDVRNNPRDRDP